MTTVTYNPFAPSYVENPYPALKALRGEAPVYPIPGGPWLLTRYQDVNQILHDRARFSVDHRNLRVGPRQEVPYERIAAILFRDPPEHTRWRQALSKAFTPAHIEALRPRVATLIDGLLDTIDDKGDVDFIEEFAAPLPFLLISELLGTPAEDRARLLAWTSDIVNLTEPVATPEVSAAIVRSSDEMRAYLKDLCAYKREHPADDIISRLVLGNADREDAAGGFTEEELISHVMLLQVSAPDPTTSHLAYGALTLARRPDQADLLREDPSLDHNAVEELLRYEAPLQITGRYPTEDIEIHGTRIEAGTAVVLSLAAANHDPAFWGDTADDIDLRRDRPHDHLSFARGIHTCFGAGLARLQGQETFGKLVRRFPRLTLTEQPRWNSLLNRRGPTLIPISVR